MSRSSFLAGEWPHRNLKMVIFASVAMSPRFRVSRQSTFVNFKMEFELESCKRGKKNVSFYCQNQRIESLGEHYTKEVCILSRNLVDGVPGPSIKRSGEKPIWPVAEDPRPVRYEHSPGSQSLNRRPHLVDERHPDTEHKDFLFLLS